MPSTNRPAVLHHFEVTSAQARCIRAVLLEALTDGAFGDDAAAAAAVRSALAPLLGGTVGATAAVLDLVLVLVPGGVTSDLILLPESSGSAVLTVAIDHVQCVIPEWDREVRLGVPPSVFEWWLAACGHLK